MKHLKKFENIDSEEEENEKYYNFIEEASIDFLENHDTTIKTNDNSISISIRLKNEDDGDINIKISHYTEVIDILRKIDYIIEKVKEKEVEYEIELDDLFIVISFSWENK